MDRSELEALAAKGAATKQAQSDRKRELLNQYEGAVSDRAKKAAMWRLSPLGAKYPGYWFFNQVSLTLYLFTFFMAGPYFRYFWTGQVVHGYSTTGGGWKLDPSKEGFALFYPFAILTVPYLAMLIARPFIWRDARKAYASALDWVETLPFALLNYPDAIGTAKRYFYVRLRGSMSTTLLENAAKGLHPGFKLSAESGHRLELELKLESDNHERNGREFNALLHALVDQVLVPLHAESPIEQVELKT